MYYILFRKGDDLMWGFDNSTMNCCICGKTQGKYVLKGLNGKICDQCQKILAIFDLVICKYSNPIRYGSKIYRKAIYRLFIC